jgi:hypothetical protein
MMGGIVASSLGNKCLVPFTDNLGVIVHEWWQALALLAMDNLNGRTLSLWIPK